MKLFTVGPVSMYEDSVMTGQVPYFRTQEFSDIMLENEILFKKLLKTGESDRVVFLTASGTGAMEACVLNGLNHKDRVLIINGGTFGERFVQICNLHGIPYEELKVNDKQEFNSNWLEAYIGRGFSTLLVNMHETSNGRLYPIDEIGEICKKNGWYFIVDGIGSFLADECYFGKWGIDLYISSSHKGLALAPGMSFITISNRFYEERIKYGRSGSLYFDFKEYIKNQDRGQTPFTPAVRVALELNGRLKHLAGKGIENEIGSRKEIAENFRQMIFQQGISFPSFRLSNALTPLLFAGGALRIYRELKEVYGMEVNPCGGENADKMLRVGHLGNVTLDDCRELVKNIVKVAGSV